MVLAYFISSVLAMIGLSGLLFYKLGATSARRKLVPNNSYYIPHIVRHIEDSAPSIFLSKSITANNHNSESGSDNPQLKYISTQEQKENSRPVYDQISYKHLTKRMTLVSAPTNPRIKNA
jgi:hypothetical protein